MIVFDIYKDYKSLSLFPYINIDWSKEAKERGSKICICFGWIFWEIYIYIV